MLFKNDLYGNKKYMLSTCAIYSRMKGENGKSSPGKSKSYDNCNNFGDQIVSSYWDYFYLKTINIYVAKFEIKQRKLWDNALIIYKNIELVS